MPKWVSLPTVVPNMRTWGCWTERWQYLLSHDLKFDIWAASVKPLGRPDLPMTELGWEFKTREEAETAVEQHRARA
jgi:hypothetical protein